MGADTMAVMQDWLGLDDAELTRLEADGVLQGVPEKVRAVIADGAYLQANR